ncbi:PAS domain S-box protein [Myxococcota bacterium]|nr:PAS domain S-box protein [Myxococcota bacterium]
MLSLKTINDLIDHFHTGPIGEALHSSLTFLEKEYDLDGVAIVLEDSSKLTFSLIASSQMRNIQGMPLKPLVKFEGPNKTVLLTSSVNTEDLSFQLELDLEDPGSLGIYYVRPIPSSIYNLIFVAFGAKPQLELLDLDTLTKLFSLLLRDSHFLRQIKEKTNRVNIEDFESEKKPKEIETYKELFETTDDGVFILNKSYEIVYMNHAGESITGYSRTALSGDPITNYISEQHAAIFSFPPNLIPSNFDMDLFTTSKEIVHLGVLRSSLLIEEGYTVLIFRDITEARHIEERLQSTSDFLMKLVDNSVVAIVACELNEKIILFNPSARNLFGDQEVDSQSPRLMSDFFPSQEDWNHILDMIADKRFGGESRLDPTKSTVRSTSGDLIPVNISAYTIPIMGDTKKAVVLFITDLREQMEMEEKLTEYRDRLAEKEKQALISELAGAMAHELNQPLMSIIGYSTLLKKPSLDPEKMERAVTHISGEAERMAEIVKKIGNLPRYETRKYVGTANILDLDRSSGGPRES